MQSAERNELDPVLDACVAVYRAELDEDAQVSFKGNSKAFVRTYSFLASILPYSNPEWEKFSIFLAFLAPKLPAPVEEDLSKGILETIDMDSYRVEKPTAIALQLEDADSEIDPVPTSGGGFKGEPELDRLSRIIQSFNEMWGSVEWTDADRVRRIITEDLPKMVSEDTAYQNARKNSDAQNARIEHDKALGRAMVALMRDSGKLFKLFSDNPSFKKWLADSNFNATYHDRA